MVETSSIFPIYIRSEYQKGQGFQRFQSDAQRAAQNAKKEFEGVANAVDSALARQRTSTGSLDLGVDELREAAAAQQARALAAREVADAALRAAQADGKFNAEMREGVTAARQYANEQERLSREFQQQIGVIDAVQRELNQTASATEKIIDAQRRGTSARGSVINSLRAERVAYVQAGQQLQDVTVQYQLGTRASQIFAQQAPQLAFALSGLERSANATKQRIGQLATFMSGPWGAAIFAATAVLGPLISDLLGFGDAAEEGEEKAFDFSRGLDVLSLSASQAESAMEQLSDSIRGSIKLQGDFLRSNAALVGQSISSLEGRIAASRSQLAEVEKRQEGIFGNNLFRPGAATDIYLASQLRSQIEADTAALARAREGAGTAAIALGQRNVEEARDPNQAEINRVNALIGDLNNRRSQAATSQAQDPLYSSTNPLFISQEDYESELSRLLDLKDAAEEAQKEANRQERSGGRKRKPRDTSAKELREAQRLAEFAEDAQSKIAGIRDRFIEIPPEVAKVNATTRTLTDIISDAQQRIARLPAGSSFRDELEAIVEEARELRTELEQTGISDAIIRDLNSLREESEQQLQIQRLILAGREDEAEVLGIMAALQKTYGDEAQKFVGTVRDIVSSRREEEELLERLQEKQEAYLDATRGVRSELEALFSGQSVNFRDVFRRLQARISVEQIFGPALRQLETAVKSSFDRSVDKAEDGFDKVGDASFVLVTELEQAAKRVSNIRPSAPPSSFDDAFASYQTGPAYGEVGLGAANDNEIVVTGTREGIEESNTALGLTPEAFAIMQGRAIVDPLLAGLPPQIASTLSPVLSSALGGYFLAGPAGGVIGGLNGLFGKGSPFGGANGIELFGQKDFFGGAFAGAAQGSQTDAILDALGLKSSQTGAAIGGALGSIFGPIGSLAGSLLGGLVGGLFKSTPRGSAIIGGSGSSLDITGFYGGSDSREQVASDLGDAVIDTIDRIADELGASVDASRGSVSIGVREDNFRVDPQGRGYTKTSKFPDILDFGQDGEAAIQAAVLDLINDGVISGLSAAEERLLKQGKDLEEALTDVLTFRSVFERLEGAGNPLRAEILKLNREFEDLIDLFERAGASSEQFAQLEELYGIERAKLIEEASDRVASSLKDLISDLTTGNNGLSLRDRQANALSEFEALRARVESGDTSAIDDFADASRTLLDIERQLFGSQQGYFDRFDEILALSRSVVTEQETATQAGIDIASPFDSVSGASAISIPIAAQTTTLVDNLAALGAKLDAVNLNLGTIAENTNDNTTGFNFDASFLYAKQFNYF